MKNADFNKYKMEIRAAIRRVLAKSEPGTLDEAAFPAYSHRNPVINFLFWQRLHKTMNYLEKHAPFSRVLDFGFGSGVMLPFLCTLSKSVIALDIDLTPFKKLSQHIKFPANLEVLDAMKTQLTDLPPASLDAIVALDVLEHVDDLDSTLMHLCSLLKPGGFIIVSGPTENWLYKIGRWLSGPEYSGIYHKCGVAQIKKSLAQQVTVSSIARLYFPITLFEIFVGTI